MSSPPLLRPTSRLVAIGWLQLALPGVRVGSKLPSVDAALRTDGFVRVPIVGGGPGRDVPMRAPVVAAECWVAPAERTGAVQWTRAEQLGERVVAATYDPALMGVVIDLSTVGSYGPAAVHTVVALSEPDRVEDDPSDFARVDVDLLIHWTA